MTKHVLLAAAVAMVVSGCAPRPETVEAAAFSPSYYQGLNCGQMNAEMRKIDNGLRAAYATQRRARTNDTWGVLLIGLPVSSIAGANVTDEIADLKGRKETLSETMTRQNCFGTASVNTASTYSAPVSTEPGDYWSTF